MKKGYLVVLFILLYSARLWSQEVDVKEEKSVLDSIYIAETESIKGEKAKVLHAEPLFIDLIRDLGARKGEKEWNVGVGLTDNLNYDSYSALVEYEWAPMDRLGLEVELPFTFYTKGSDKTLEIPGARLNGLKTAIQYTFLVSEKKSFSAAFGYINELEFVAFNEFANSNVLKGNVYNPFLVAAKRWGNNFHTLIYTGPMLEQTFGEKGLHVNYQINSNIHYMISGTRNFIGLEINKEIMKGDFDMVLRPQMRLEISEHLLIGIVAGIPVTRENERFSAFARIIYEPPHKDKSGKKAVKH